MIGAESYDMAPDATDEWRIVARGIKRQFRPLRVNSSVVSDLKAALIDCSVFPGEAPDLFISLGVDPFGIDVDIWCSLMCPIVFVPMTGTLGSWLEMFAPYAVRTSAQETNDLAVRWRGLKRLSWMCRRLMVLR